MSRRFLLMISLTSAIGLCLSNITNAQTTITSSAGNTTFKANPAPAANTITVNVKWNETGGYEPDRVKSRILTVNLFLLLLKMLVLKSPPTIRLQIPGRTSTLSTRCNTALHQ